MSSSSHCDLCGTEIVQGSCQNPDCENCSCYFDDESSLLEQARELLAFPDIDDDEWIVNELMKMLKVKRGVNPKPL